MTKQEHVKILFYILNLLQYVLDDYSLGLLLWHYALILRNNTNNETTYYKFTVATSRRYANHDGERETGEIGYTETAKKRDTIKYLFLTIYSINIYDS